MEYAYRFRTASAWSTMAELARRHPDATLVHVWGHNTWDRLMLEDREGKHVVATINSPGLPLNPSGPGMSWLTVAALGPRTAARRIEEIVGLHGPIVTPSTTPKTLTYRTLACLCAFSLGTVNFLDPRWGIHWEEEDHTLQEGFFQAVPHCGEHRRFQTQHRPLTSGVPSSRVEADYWFLVPWPNRSGMRNTPAAATPAAAIHIEGVMWVGDGEAVDLVQLYDRSGRDFAPFMDAVVALFGTRLKFLT